MTVNSQVEDPVKEEAGKERVIVFELAMLLGTKNLTANELDDVVEYETVERTELDKQFVQGVLTYAALVSDEVSIFNPDVPLAVTAANPPTVRPLHVTVTRPDGKAAPLRVIVMALEL